MTLSASTEITINIPELNLSLKLKDYTVNGENEVREKTHDQSHGMWKEYEATGRVKITITGKRVDD